MQRWRKKYNKTVESLANKSRRQHSHPNEHTQKEMELISKKYQYHKHERLGQVYRKCKESGYKRSYGSMCKQIRKQKSYEKAKRISYPKSKYKALTGTYPWEYVEIDVKYVPNECIGFKISNEMVEEYLKGAYDATNNEYSSQGTLRFTIWQKNSLSVKTSMPFKEY